MTPEELNILRTKRASIKGMLTRFKNFISNMDETNLDIQLIRVKLEKIEPVWDSFEQVQQKLDLYETDKKKEENEREYFENEFCSAVSLARSFIEGSGCNEMEEVASSVASSCNNPQINTDAIKLPKIELPTFDGKWEEFISFREEFNSIIDARNDLKPVQKFRYLVKALKGDAALAIKAMEITNANYKEAWEILETRFDSKRRIITKHIRVILDVEAIDRFRADKLQKLIDTVASHLRSITAMGYCTNEWDPLLVVIIVRKLDPITRQKWEQVGNQKEMPSMAQLMKFLQDRVHVLESLREENSKEDKGQVHQRGWLPRSKSLTAQNKTNVDKTSNEDHCGYCGKRHKLYFCYLFRKLSANNRVSEIKRLHLCENCFREGHTAEECKGLPCKKCAKKHNTLLHIEKDKVNSEGLNEFSPKTTSISRNAFSDRTGTQKVKIMLSTVMVHLKSKEGNLVECRVLLDSGSQSNFISEQLAKRLSLPVRNTNLAISGIGGKITEPLKVINCSIKSRYEPFDLDLECLVLPRVTLPIPEAPLNTSTWNIPNDIFLADPKFQSPNDIDLLIGAEHFFNVVKQQQISLGENLPMLQRTVFGWIVVGKLINKPNNNLDSDSIEISQCGCSALTIEESLKLFWETEELSHEPVMSLEEKICEKKFEETTKRDGSGRFVVNLPVKENIAQLGDTEQMALRRFYNMEKRLEKDKALKEEYCKFMKEYSDLGHMREVTQIDQSSPVYYMPHHSVINEHSSTTRFRVVFDASAKSSTGLSLNDVLMVGPTIQQDLISIILRFRQYQYVITADITKMYRQVRVAEKHTSLQTIFWRDDSKQPIKKYQLQTVTYGTAPASYLATRCLKQAALENSERFPKGSATILKDFYMDDLVHGCDSIEEINIVKNELSIILSEAGFKLHKWCSNELKLLTNISEELKEKKYVPNQEDSSIKALGIWWYPVKDSLRYSINIPENNINTKRGVLSEAAKLFDPLGLVGPIVVKAKIFLQGLWAAGVDWDEPLSQIQSLEWFRFRSELIMLEKLEIPRLIKQINSSVIELHGFSDASERAYGATIYIKSINDEGNINSHLLCAKSRVAPLKKQTLPRLELCGALLLARLLNKVLKCLEIKFDRKILWCDSTIVLAWLHSPSSRWRTFVANRVSEIQELTITCEWRHVSSEENPADKISRGLFPSEIINDVMWWNGPKWLYENKTDCSSNCSMNYTTVEEQKIQGLAATEIKTSIIDWKRFSSYSKLIRTVMFVNRFIDIKLNRKAEVIRGLNMFYSREWLEAERTILLIVQNEEFLEEREVLKRKVELSRKSKILSLCPFLDNNDVLRVGGRIVQSEVPYEHKHPILLPARHWVTHLIMTYYHIKYLHAGPQGLLAAVRRKFWPINGLGLAKKIVRTCIICVKCNPKENTQLMGQIPKERFSMIRAFYYTGVDYCGPIQIKFSNKRNAKAIKAYVAIFVCLSVKAVHIELVMDMTTEAFLNALKRFYARRGKSKLMISDNGTNFVGAKRILHQNFVDVIQNEKISSYLMEENISWKLIPPRAPQFGGLWEAAVKSFKYHFKRISGQSLLTYEEMYTLVCLIESILNSRPLCPLSSDPNDLNPLTPGHFIIGDALAAIPQPDCTKIKISNLKRWRRVEHLFRQFWIRWTNEYLSNLQKRSKWLEKRPNLQPGQLVLLKEEGPPLKWAMARILKTHPGDDGLVRVVTVKTVNGTVKRPISKLCLLPIEESEKEEDDIILSNEEPV